jgi:hypothetical protein
MAAVDAPETPPPSRDGGGRCAWCVRRSDGFSGGGGHSWPAFAVRLALVPVDALGVAFVPAPAVEPLPASWMEDSARAIGPFSVLAPGPCRTLPRKTSPRPYLEAYRPLADASRGDAL